MTVQGLNRVRIVTLAGSRWMSNYYITPATGSSDQLERKCWNENHVPAEAGPPGPPLSSPGERERKAVIARRVEGSICCRLCSVTKSLSDKTPSIKWEVYFSKELCPLVFIVLNVFLHACCICECMVVTVQQGISRSWSVYLVSLFNGISTFVGYIIPKPFTEKNRKVTI